MFCDRILHPVLYVYDFRKSIFLLESQHKLLLLQSFPANKNTYLKNIEGNPDNRIAFVFGPEMFHLLWSVNSAKNHHSVEIRIRKNLRKNGMAMFRVRRILQNSEIAGRECPGTGNSDIWNFIHLHQPAAEWPVMVIFHLRHHTDSLVCKGKGQECRSKSRAKKSNGARLKIVDQPEK